jgi:hypothetical protein
MRFRLFQRLAYPSDLAIEIHAVPARRGGQNSRKYMSAERATELARHANRVRWQGRPRAS